MLRTMGDRLQHLHVRDAFLLLRHSIAMPRLLYILRSSPCFLTPALPKYDSILRSVTSSVININLQDDDSAWLQASLPVNLGGLGIRSVGQLAPSAFLASAAASSSLANLFLPFRLHIIPYFIVDEALLHWEQAHEQPPPPPDASHRQKAWDLPRVEAAVQSLMGNALDARSRARLLAATSKVRRLAERPPCLLPRPPHGRRVHSCWSWPLSWGPFMSASSMLSVWCRGRPFGHSWA